MNSVKVDFISTRPSSDQVEFNKEENPHERSLLMQGRYFSRLRL